ncbi:MAG: cytoplasmic protein [Desulfobacterales bacterium CG23_combo_of_CG06-09_8_20_14_all_51_8]|nr:MAG: cytoplasmic protein [Desulfobacterales bacterium CG23_combo_of_CG06-09_8_20_14_all_51_8]
MSKQESVQNINFTIDQNNLFREESITDFKVGSIRRLVPIKPDGTPDASRTELFIGQTQLMSPEGPLPIQSELEAKTLAEAIAVFPTAMKEALAEMVEQLQQLQRQRQTQERDKSRIIVPGR